MEAKKLFAVLALSLVLFAGAAAIKDSLFKITDVDFDSTVAPGDVLDIEYTLENTAKNTATDTADNLENINLRVSIKDFRGEDVLDKTKFELGRALNYDSEIKNKHIKVSLPVDIEEGVYTLKIEASGEWEDGNGYATATYTDTFEVEGESHSFAVTALEASPSIPTAGETIDVAVTLLNNGVNDESDVRIRVEIPELKVSETVALLSSLAAGQERMQYLQLTVPSNAKADIYTLKATAYNAGMSKSFEKDFIVDTIQQVNTAKDVLSPVTQKLAANIELGKGAVLSTKLTNNADVAKTYELILGGVKDWTTSARVDPSTVTIAPREQATVRIYLLPSEAGKHTATLFIRENGNTISFINLEASVKSAGIVPTTGSNTAALVFTVIVIVLAIGVALWQFYSKDKNRKTAIYY